MEQKAGLARPTVQIRDEGSRPRGNIALRSLLNEAEWRTAEKSSAIQVMTDGRGYLVHHGCEDLAEGTIVSRAGSRLVGLPAVAGGQTPPDLSILPNPPVALQGDRPAGVGKACRREAGGRQMPHAPRCRWRK
ncbi:hypothetical protein CENSYa_0715 [Cenarchaeum symbiosum A]|uniref:Uncharacterized protein n=1 Tax=Cenarchaeum symbiosum (strain A) TaxID=414004 RepID=A0RVI1_CENSY|nr:hypothetical protein CENSYa_0715 [Cenarchaeum symbiosum A]